VLHVELVSDSNGGLGSCIELAVKHVDKYRNLASAKEFKTLLNAEENSKVKLRIHYTEVSGKVGERI